MRKFIVWLCLPIMLSTSFQVMAKEQKNPSSKNQVIKTETSYPYQVDQVIDIDVSEREMAVNTDGQALSQFTYTITNKSKIPVSGIQWLNVYVHDRQVVYSQDMQLDLENPLQPSKSVKLNLQIPFVQIDEKFRPIFMNAQMPIQVYKLQRIVRLIDNKEIADD